MVKLYYAPIFLEHETGQHPECAARLEAVMSHLEATGLLAQCNRGEVRPAEISRIAAVHGADQIAGIERLASLGGGRIDADTVVSPRSFDVARSAVGAALEAVDDVLSGTCRHAVSLSRPPGHHALPSTAMGFCLFNNVAIAAEHARSAHGLERILIVDWDVHHGNGTQDIFYEDSGTYFFSAHRYPFYPGTGDAGETGTGAGLGTIFNLPISFGVSRFSYRERFQTMLHDAAERARPELILISAGFDAHAADPIGSLGLETEDFADLTTRVLQIADHYCGGKTVSLLEGGYNPTALAESVALHLQTLLAHEAK